ncbi:unnamed protein product [Bemisia tabaci]|nr:unnamed protein product [Bemisia tabaci]
MANRETKRTTSSKTFIRSARGNLGASIKKAARSFRRNNTNGSFSGSESDGSVGTHSSRHSRDNESKKSRRDKARSSASSVMKKINGAVTALKGFTHMGSRDKDRSVSRSNRSDRDDSRSEAGSLVSQDSYISRFMRDSCTLPHGPGGLPKEQQRELRAELKGVRDKLCSLDTEAGLSAVDKDAIALKLAQLEFRFCPQAEGSRREGDFAREFLASQAQPPPSPSRPPQVPPYRPPSPPRGTPTPESPSWTYEEANSVKMRLQQYNSEHHGGNQSPNKSPRRSRSGSPTRRPRASPPRASSSPPRNWKPASPPRGPAAQIPTDYHGPPPDAVTPESPVSNNVVTNRWKRMALEHFAQTPGETDAEAHAKSRAFFMERLCPSHAGNPGDGPRQEIPAAPLSYSAPGPVLARPGTPGTPLSADYMEVGERVNHYLRLFREEEEKQNRRRDSPPPPSPPPPPPRRPGRLFTSNAQ